MEIPRSNVSRIDEKEISTTFLELRANALAKGTRARSASRNGKGHTHAYRITGNLFILRESMASEYRIDTKTTYFSLNHNLNTETYRGISLSILYKISISFNVSNVSFP